MSDIIRVSSSLEIDIRELAAFLIWAKPQGYAAKNPLVVNNPIRPYFKELEPIVSSDPTRTESGVLAMRNNWVYYDSYTGSIMAPGQEYATYNFLPVWAMGYAGGMLRQFWQDQELTQEVFAYLKRLLRTPDINVPIRGPMHHTDGDLTYILRVEGDLTFFTATERILKLKQDVFRQHMCGSIIVHKL